MRVRLRLHPRKYWVVESMFWYDLSWNYEQCFHGDDAYERAHEYGRLLKNNYTEEIT
jgi:hypothetical protein